MSEPSLSGSGKFRDRLKQVRARVQKIMPFLSGVLAALLALLIYNSLSPQTQITQTDVNNAVESAMASATPRPPFAVGVYQIIQPSLVLIQTESDGTSGELDHSLGSGVIINDQGDVLTANHVVEGAKKITLTFADGTKAEGTIASSQPDIDIAMVTPSALPQLFVPATVGNAGALQEGDDAFVVGNPFGLYSSMSAGVISGFDRTFQPPDTNHEISGLIQVDAAINPGNSGGPLLNRSGHVVGIVTGIINPTEDNFFIGIGFAVPINVAASQAGGLPPY
ncbi:MAG TPA: trypsin-like peptidase domain-containing protein [Anaerolineales bacterium]|nr:trypsin-like peptidase domain-containing protein [Anaerolineales bacterium]